MASEIYFGTKRVAKLAGVEQHTVTAEVRRRGHWRGVVPRRLTNGQLSFPGVKVYQALGLLPDGPRYRGPVARLQQTLCARAPQLDPFHTHQAVLGLFATRSTGETPEEEHAAILIDAGHLDDILRAFCERAADMMRNEDLFSADQIRQLNHIAEDIKHAAEVACQPLRWRTPATATGGQK